MSTDNARRGGTHENGITARPGLTVQQSRLLDLIIDYKRTHDGNTPTRRQLAETYGAQSPSTVYYQIEAIILAGYLRRLEGGMLCVVGATWAPPEDNQPSSAKYARRRPRIGGRTRRCECGRIAEFILLNEHGHINLCRSCARLELDTLPE